MKLYYFDLPGRGEATRLMFHYGGVAFEDFRFGFDLWPSIKPTTPFGQVPVLEFQDGSKMAQSSAIEFFAATQVGLLPADTLQVARCFEVAGLIDDCFKTLNHTMTIQDVAEKTAARKLVMETTLHEKLQLLGKIIGTKDFFVGDKLSYADILVFTSLSFWASGFYDGLNSAMLAGIPNLQAHHKRIASLPFVKAYSATRPGDFYKCIQAGYF